MADQTDLDFEIASEDQEEYYTLLNVPKTATTEEIRTAYRRLCKIYHPDRHQDTDKQETASKFFKRIQEAYQVLSDERLKAIYDMSGKKGITDDRSIIERTSLPRELMEEYEKLKALFEERTYIQEVNPHGLFQLTIDATPLFASVENDQNRSLISVKNAYTQQSVSAKFGKYTDGNLTGSMFVTQRTLYTGLQCSIKQQLSNQNWVKVTGMLSSMPSLGLDFYHNISDRVYVTSENVLQVSPLGFGASFNGKVTCKLNDTTTGSLYVKKSGNAVGITISQQVKEKIQISCDAQVGYDDSFVQLSSKFQPQESIFANVSGRLGTKGPSIAYGVDHNFGKLTQAGARVILSSSTGIELRLRLIRATVNYVIKLQLSPVVTLPGIFYASFIPVFLYGCIRLVGVGPLLNQQKATEMEEKIAEREREMMDRKREAELAVELMKETVERIVATETSKHGLIILEAWYGCLFTTLSHTNPLAPPQVINVTIPLQCLVTDSKLILRETSKSLVPGFYDPCIGEKKYLRVKYKFRGCVHEVTIENNESLMIPRQSHRLRVSIEE
jgi:DnaJ family protein C protein 11